jgi:Response regulator of the LytR/AlgR family
VDGIFESKGTLTDLEQRLDENIFFRCHRSYIINLDYVEYIDPWFNQTYTVKLRSNKEEIPVSRAGAKNLKRLITL